MESSSGVAAAIQAAAEAVVGSQPDDEGIQGPRGIIIRDPKKTSAIALTQYLDKVISDYKRGPQFSKALWVSFRHGFRKWDKAAFERADGRAVDEVYGVLRERGVYMAEDGDDIIFHLLRLLTENYPEWPHDEELPDAYREYMEAREKRRNGISTPKVATPPPSLGIKPEGTSHPKGTPPIDPALKGTAIQDTTLKNASSKWNNPLAPEVPFPDLHEDEHGEYEAIQHTNKQKPSYDSNQLTSYNPAQDIVAEGPPVMPNFAFSPVSNKDLYIRKALAGYKQGGCSTEITRLMKVYKEDWKYSGDGDIFNHKFDIFLYQCQKADVAPSSFNIAFDTMLKGRALAFYYHNQHAFKSIPMEPLGNAFRTNFEGPDHDNYVLMEWNKVHLQTFISENRDKKLKYCFELMIDKLRMLQEGLYEIGKQEMFIRTKLITGIKGIPALEHVYKDPKSTAAGMIHAIRAAANQYNANNPPAATSETLLTDRKYYNQKSNFSTNQKYGNRGQSSYSNRGRTSYGNRSQTSKYSKGSKDGCYMPGCKDPNCRTWKHSKEERERFHWQHLTDMQLEENDHSPSSEGDEAIQNSESTNQDVDTALTPDSSDSDSPHEVACKVGDG